MHILYGASNNLDVIRKVTSKQLKSVYSVLMKLFILDIVSIVLHETKCLFTDITKMFVFLHSSFKSKKIRPVFWKNNSEGKREKLLKT